MRGGKETQKTSTPKIIPIDPDTPETDRVAEAVRILRQGGVIAYPTETFYGLGADAQNEEALDRIFRIKGREAAKPLPVIIGREKELPRLTTEVPEIARLLIRRFWPGALTLVFNASPHVPSRLTAGTGKIGIRISGHPLACLLAKTLNRALTATSANPSGAPSCTSAEEVIRCLGERVDAVIDGGITTGGSGSTVLDVTSDPPLLLREGTIPSALLQKELKATLNRHFS